MIFPRELMIMILNFKRKYYLKFRKEWYEKKLSMEWVFNRYPFGNSFDGYNVYVGCYKLRYLIINDFRRFDMWKINKSFDRNTNEIIEEYIRITTFLY